MITWVSETIYRGSFRGLTKIIMTRERSEFVLIWRRQRKRAGEYRLSISEVNVAAWRNLKPEANRKHRILASSRINMCEGTGKDDNNRAVRGQSSQSVGRLGVD